MSGNTEARGTCYWFGESDKRVEKILESQGFTLVAKDLAQPFKFEPESTQLYYFSAPATPSDDIVAKLASKARYGHTVIVRSGHESKKEWYDAGADLVLVDDMGGLFDHLLSFALSTYDERRHWREAEDRLTRSNDDLRATIESLEIASRRFEALFSGLPVGCFTFDSHGLIHEWNGLSSSIFGIEGYQAFLNRVWDILDPDFTGVWSQEIVKKIFETGEGLEFDWKFIRDDGETVHLACKVVCMTNKKGEVIAAVAGNLDITARVIAQEQLEEQMRENRNYLKVMERQRLKLQEANRQLRRLAVTDGLTSLTNRRRFNELLEEVLDRAIRQNQTFSVLMFDIDHFKSLNDVFGHQAGDEILEQFAKVLKETARRYERPARYGGEEFAIILDNCDRQSCLIAAERFRSAINDYHWPYRAVTASIGCSTFSGIESVRDLVEQADIALYASKKAGRNRVTHIDDIPREAREQKAA